MKINKSLVYMMLKIYIELQLLELLVVSSMLVSNL